MNILILLVSLLVYAGYGIPGLAYLLAVVLLTYAAGLLIPRHRWAMWLSVGANVLLLCLVKLQPMTGMALPAIMGVSYITFQVISYNVDIYRGKYEPERNLLRYSLFVAYLPHVFIGPIERYDHFRLTAFRDRRITWDGISGGAVRVVWGLFKKLVIASRAGVIVSAISGDTEVYFGAYAFLAMLMYSIQLYADFSGGMDIVLGVSHMLGIHLSENFDAPYFSQSVQEFWKRWHITLGSWLRDYVYIPLGGNRKGQLRKYLNLVITFLVSGLWHGVSYVLWGLFNGIFVCFGSKLKTRFAWVNRAGTFLLITFLWSFFVWPDAATAVKMAGSVFTSWNWVDLAAQIGQLGLNLGEWIVLIAGVAVLWCYDARKVRLGEKFRSLCPAGRTAVICALGLAVLVFGMYGIGFNAEEFIYSRF